MCVEAAEAQKKAEEEAAIAAKKLEEEAAAAKLKAEQGRRTVRDNVIYAFLWLSSHRSRLVMCACRGKRR